jgi:proteasome lid subunit RPN8/RPN11
MFELEEAVIQAIRDHGDRCSPREACGLLIGTDAGIDYKPCENLSENANQFYIKPSDYADAEDQGKVLAVVHTHVNEAPTPSAADRTSCATSGLPWLIMSIPLYETEWLMPEAYIAPLIGRKFVFGVHDCYSIIRDWYMMELGIQLPDFEREDNFWEPGPNQKNLYLDNFEKAGFYRLPSGTEPQRGDVFLMQIRTPIPAHGAVYIGDDMIIHHLQSKNSLSRRDVYGGTWAYLTTHHLRYA